MKMIVVGCDVKIPDWEYVFLSVALPVVLQRLENGVLGEKSKIDEERDPRLGNLVRRTDMVSLIALRPTQSHSNIQVSQSRN